ncbi:MAG: hypoxanthine phosphoribosyltransferase [Anaerolineales bacterium]|nr:hypoxanthine phosphoribosyltransferase [Anaerolineales bacterium]MCW5854522.1 hypoxanthine phosphoribosyltransferase [Anaerolineales bacterium]
MPLPPPYQDLLAEILIPEDALQKRIGELGAQISRDYTGQDLLLICILRGGVMFLTDLIRAIETPHSIDFMAVSSYGAGARQTSGQVRINMDLSIDIAKRHVLLVEDIVDSGNTIASVLKLLQSRGPASLKVCTLLDKPAARQTPVPIDYTGFIIESKFVFGYGLDLDEYYRNLPFIGVVDLDKYQPPK